MSEKFSYTPEEVANILQISRFTVYELIKRGELSAYRIGRKLRIDPIDLNKYKAQAKGEPISIITEKQITAIEDAIIICGQDIILDTLTRHLERKIPHISFLRYYIGSIDGLINLYKGKVNVASVHLWDGDTGEYNIPYVRHLIPGHKVAIFNLVYRTEGFYVASNNPKQITTWSDLIKPNILFVNREPGSGARVLLDEKLRQIDIEHTSIHGYKHEENSHIAVASCVARGEADVGIGTEQAALQVRGIDFVPLMKERYDLVIKKADLLKPHFQTLLSTIQSDEFRNEIAGMGGYDVAQMGHLIAEI